MNAKKGRLPERIEHYLTRSGLGAGQASIVPLTGDASDRKYFRVLPRRGSSVVLALHTEPFDHDTQPFVRVAELFGRMPLPVPAILDRAGDLGILIMEDLGDITLQAHLGVASAAEHARLYRQAVAFIEVIQRRGDALASPAFPPYGISFDRNKLLWELEFFTKHFLEAYRGVSIPPSTREALRHEWERLADELAAEPRVLCHRDYHSRNLMLHHGGLRIIDFQDARLGPDTYDLVSLLRDSYVDLPEPSVEELIDYFIALKTPRQGEGAWSASDWEGSFRRRFDVMALQRNLKALGTFGYQTTTRQNPVYIQYIPRTVRHLEKNMARHPDRFGRLREVLSGLMADV